jgi:hypothetical protein
MSRCNDENRSQLLNFVVNAPFDEFIIAMDCREACEQLSRLAELVANGADLSSILPQLEEHMAYWTDCREEFMALVAILKAEREGKM